MMEIQIKDKIRSMTMSIKIEFLFMTIELVSQFTCMFSFKVYAKLSLVFCSTGLCKQIMHFYVKNIVNITRFMV